MRHCHLSSEVLQLLDSPQRVIEILVAHLREVCPECQVRLAGPEDRGGDAVAGDELQDALSRFWVERLGEVVSRAEGEMVVAQREIEELRERSDRIAVVTSAESGFRGRGFAELVLAEGARALTSAPFEAESWARIGLHTAEGTGSARAALRARSLALLGSALRVQGQWVKAEEAMREALAVADGLGSDVDAEGEVLWRAASLDLELGRWEAAEVGLLSALSSFDAVGAQEKVSSVKLTLVRLLVEVGRLEEAERIARSLVEMGGQLGALATAARLSLAFCELELGKTAEAVRWLLEDRAAAGSGQDGRRRWAWGLVAAQQGDWATATERLGCARALFEEAGELRPVVLVGIDLAYALESAGRYEEAVKVARETHTLAEALPLEVRGVTALMLRTLRKRELTALACRNLKAALIRASAEAKGRLAVG